MDTTCANCKYYNRCGDFAGKCEQNGELQDANNTCNRWEKRTMKLTVIFRGCGQDGIDHWSNYAMTRIIKLTEEQEKLLIPPQGMTLSEVICEEEE